MISNSKNEIVQATAGDLVASHEELIATYDQMYKVKINGIADILISAPDYPRGINLYQAMRAGSNFVLVPKPLIKRGGDNYSPGDQLFYE